MSAELKTWPERVYLQSENEHGDGTCAFEPGHEITWCQDQISAHDVEYVRADLVAAPAQGALTDALPELPKPDTHCYDEDTRTDVWSHSADQMHAYAKQYAATRAQQHAVSDAADVCKWTLSNEEFGPWESSCGEAWSFIDGGPVENGVRFCQGCGKPTQIAAIQAQAGDAPGGA